MRRLRSHPALRELIQETHLLASDFVYPLFIKEGNKIRNPINSMPGQFQLSLDNLSVEIDEIVSLNIPAIILFGIPNHKDHQGSHVLAETGIVQQAIKLIKKQAPDLLVIADVCFCEYTDHGHCGVVTKNHHGENDVDNDKTLALLAEQAISMVKAGADVIAPSGMMDGMVHTLREALDINHFKDIPILSYAVKYASSFYGPFREAAEGSPQFGDRRSYQMDPANSSEAVREAGLDIEEGADMLMVKPAQHYLDIVYRIKTENPGVPMCAYQVSGEFAMIKAASEKGWIDEKKAALESLLAIKRAGADFIITYYAKEAARWLQK